VDQKQYSPFIDLREAFDIIDHRVRLERLSKYGFGETEANWICSYLTDRQQYVVCNGVQSQQLPINYGVSHYGVHYGDNKMIPNVKKTKSMISGSRQALKRANDIEIYLDNEILDVVTTFDYLGVRISNILSWEQHVSRICQRLYPKLGLLNRISSFLPSVILLRIYKQTILPIQCRPD
jgi:hypothetical protein